MIGAGAGQSCSAVLCMAAESVGCKERWVLMLIGGGVLACLPPSQCSIAGLPLHWLVVMVVPCEGGVGGLQAM